MAQQENALKSDGPLRGGPQQIRPWASLAFRDYRLLWAAARLSTFGLQMQQFANAWQVYELSGSALQRLKELEEKEGVVERRVHASRPVMVDHALTAKGADLRRVVVAIQAWADRWEREAEKAKAVAVRSGRR